MGDEEFVVEDDIVGDVAGELLGDISLKKKENIVIKLLNLFNRFESTIISVDLWKWHICNTCQMYCQWMERKLIYYFSILNEK